MRITAGSATFLVKVKSHRGEPINEQADGLAEKGRQEEDDASTWTTRMGEWFLRKRANIVESSLCGQGAFAT